MTTMSFEGAVRVLNELLAADPIATNTFFNLTVPVNQDVCEHPTIQVIAEGRMSTEGVLRPLGLINGLFADGRVIAMVMDESCTEITGFRAAIVSTNGAVEVS